mgnify:CR=1 FL=1
MLHVRAVAVRDPVQLLALGVCVGVDGAISAILVPIVMGEVIEAVGGD